MPKSRVGKPKWNDLDTEDSVLRPAYIDDDDDDHHHHHHLAGAPFIKDIFFAVSAQFTCHTHFYVEVISILVAVLLCYLFSVINGR